MRQLCRVFYFIVSPDMHNFRITRNVYKSNNIDHRNEMLTAAQKVPQILLNSNYHYCLHRTPLLIRGINLLKPTGHVMHQQFNIQQLYVLPTLYLCVLYLSENKQRLVPLTA
jgi:hypothetical protein